MPYSKKGTRGESRPRHRPSSEFNPVDNNGSRPRTSRTVPVRRTFVEDQPRYEERERPSLLSFPITETVRQTPIVPEKKKERVEETHTKCQKEREGSNDKIGEEEGAVGGVLEPIIPVDQWDDIASLERKREPKMNPNVEIVVPYRWPLQRKKGESKEAFHSRLAEEDLERFLRQMDKPTSSKLEDLRYKQRQVLKERSGGVLRKEDIESRHPTPQRPRSHTPPGPPIVQWKLAL
ncbi:uncharacterized protein LOC122511140 [Leptopilina heterotoma]|uniref:uncharacterized protein LOC122511140 n=1 Tax=Leptopilina heterotoma TaxID=63436 RepID=UPI001CA9E552|nr:uncharacterized protein LOC122511140 [Leptopilina heterotoma]